MTAASVLIGLVKGGTYYWEHGDFGSAGLALMEGSARVGAVDPQLRAALRNASVSASIRALGIDERVTSGPRGVRLTVEMRHRIAEFQEKKGIAVDPDKVGQPTYATLLELSARTPWELINPQGAYDVPDISSDNPVVRFELDSANPVPPHSQAIELVIDGNKIASLRKTLP